MVRSSFFSFTACKAAAPSSITATFSPLNLNSHAKENPTYAARVPLPLQPRHRHPKIHRDRANSPRRLLNPSHLRRHARATQPLRHAHAPTLLGLRLARLAALALDHTRPSFYFFSDASIKPDIEGESLIKPAKGTYIPWSGSARVCVGRNFAQVEFAAVIALLFQKYRVRL